MVAKVVHWRMHVCWRFQSKIGILRLWWWYERGWIMFHLNETTDMKTWRDEAWATNYRARP